LRARRLNAYWLATSPLTRPGVRLHGRVVGQWCRDLSRLMHGLGASQVRQSLPDCRQYVRNVNSAWGACTPAPLPASRRSTHFKPLRILKSPHATTACGAPSRSSDLNAQGRPPLQGGEGDPKPSIRCDREWERFKRIKRRIISCAQLGSRTFERTRTNQEVYYQPTGVKTQ
jgi:hypothetical protein